MLTVKKEIDLMECDFLSKEAADTINTVFNDGKIEDLEFLIKEVHGDEITEVQLNDFLWFDKDWIYQTLNINIDDID